MVNRGQRARCTAPSTSEWRLRLIGLVAAAFVCLAAAPAAHASCTSPANEIEAENCNPGTPGWDISGDGDDSIQGFATDISVDQGGTIGFKVKTDAPAYTIDIYRLGYYQGIGARQVASLPVTGPSNASTPCETTGATGPIDCGNWAVSASWNVPENATSGIYVAALVRPGGASHVPFVVRDDDGRSDVLFQTSDTTWQAYNSYGGKSLYLPTRDTRAYKVSYNRPFNTRENSSEDWLFNSEYPMVRWLERNGYDVSYFSGVDSDRFGPEIREHRAFLSVGHDEYWSGTQRANVEAARNAGVNLAFFSGNEIFWKTRWEDNHRTLVSYKETHGDAIDPTDASTGSWRDPRFGTDGGRPENALTGTIFMVNSGTSAIQVPAADGKMRFWRGTDVANLAQGATATLLADTLGYEWDEDLDNGSRPAGLVRLSSTTADVPQMLQDYGSIYAAGTATHHLTLYRATNGAEPDALVFGAGTIQWPWGLDNVHDRGGDAPSPAMQQATTNLFADMGVQPASLVDGQPAVPSTDTAPPSSTITSPATIGVTAGTPATVQGTAVDSGGGRVGAIEVSVDGGATWHPATGRESWTYTWTPAATGSVTPRVRAADDSGNLFAPVDPAPPTVTAVLPTVDSVGVDTATKVSATFDEALNASTVNTGTVQLRDAGGALVPAGVSYAAATHTATLTPTGPLAAAARYTATITTGIKDAAGNALAQPRTWSFTTAAAHGTPDPGGEPGAQPPGTNTGTGSPGTGAPGTRPGDPATSASDRVAPRVRVSPRSTRVSRGGIATLRVACPAGERRCRVTLRLRLGRRIVATRTLTVIGGDARSFRLTLRPDARRALVRKRALRVTAIAAARDLAGNRATTHTDIRLLAPRRSA